MPHWWCTPNINHIWLVTIDCVLVLPGYQNLVHQILNYLNLFHLHKYQKIHQPSLTVSTQKFLKIETGKKKKQNSIETVHTYWSSIPKTFTQKRCLPISHCTIPNHKSVEFTTFNLCIFILIKFDLFSQILSVSLISSYPISQSLLSYMNNTHKNKNNLEKKRIEITKKPRWRLVWCMKIAIF